MQLSFRSGLPTTMRVLVLFVGFAMSGQAWAQQLVTSADIKRISPKAKDELVQAFVSGEAEFEKAGITTRLRMAHFLSQVLVETGGLRAIDENLNYSYKRALAVFSRKTLPELKARELAGNPRGFANWVYGNRLGNRGRDTDDGWLYRGSGYIQLTGRDNFIRRGKAIEIALADSPDLAREPQKGLIAAIAFWDALKLNGISDDNDLYLIRKRVNGPAAHGYPEAKVWFAIAWKKVFAAKAGQFESDELVAGVNTDEAGLLDAVLQENGYLPEATEAGTETPVSREDAIKSFQRDVGLPETGTIDLDTQYELLDQWRQGDPDVAVPPAEETREQTVSFALAGGRESDVFSEPNAGTGEIDTGDVTLPPSEQQALEDATGSYSEYEMGRKVVVPERFEPHAILSGSDDRVAVTATLDFPARAIVQIVYTDEKGRKKLCSGSMIASDAVLTAAHCLHSGTANGSPFTDFRVMPGRNALAAPFGLCRGKSFSVLSGWTNSVSPTESRYYDMGVLKLDCSVGEKTGWFGLRPMSDDEKKSTVVEGYASDSSPTGIQLRSTGDIKALTTYNGFYDNDTYGGTSGSGVTLDGDPATLVGVHTTGAFGDERPWSEWNGFVRLTPDRIARVLEWAGQ